MGRCLLHTFTNIAHRNKHGGGNANIDLLPIDEGGREARYLNLTMGCRVSNAVQSLYPPARVPSWFDCTLGLIHVSRSVQ